MNTPLLLNIGSGQRPFVKPWINCDKQAVCKPDLIWDAGNPCDPAPFKPDTVDCIVLHHVLEHLPMERADLLLGQCLQLLKRHCSVLVFVPDMWELSAMWREGKLSDDLYLANVYGAYMGDEADRHKWGYTPATLRGKVRSAGFRWAHEFLRRDVWGADIALDRWILAMEAVK